MLICQHTKIFQVDYSELVYYSTRYRVDYSELVYYSHLCKYGTLVRYSNPRRIQYSNCIFQNLKLARQYKAMLCACQMRHL